VSEATEYLMALVIPEFAVNLYKMLEGVMDQDRLGEVCIALRPSVFLVILLL
jgi:hypothetical protein